jgi:hypothetical protein
MTSLTRHAALLAASLAIAPTLQAQTRAPRRGLERSVLPALNFDADEKFGYGAVVEVYDYGEGTAAPYRWTVQPTVFLTTAGRRDFTVFVDAPHVLPGGWRVDAYAGSERQLATPFYGAGNETAYDAARDEEGGPDPYFYRYGLQRRQASANVQHRLGRLPLRVLLGAGAAHAAVDATPFDEGSTLLAESGAALGPMRGWSNHVRAGLVWDTRDRETAPRGGAWSEALVQRVDARLGSDRGYTRWTVTDRRYASTPSGRLTLANRVLLQGVEGDAPFWDLPVIASSFRQQEGLGGAKTLRGLPRNRYVGRGVLLWNTEARWRAAEFRAPVLHRPSHVVLSAFVDKGRVWEDRVRLGEALEDLHVTGGGGVRLGLGESFVVAADAGWAKAAAPSVYVGLGYLF